MLVTEHPVQMVLGSMLIQEELATKGNQLTFGVIARDCMEWAHEIRDVMAEIAAEADVMTQRVELYASDGVFDMSERDELLRNCQEIATEAREGRAL